MSAAVVELLRAGRERVARGWTQGTLARDALLEPTDAFEPDATCWCAVGAVTAELHVPETRTAEALRRLRKALPRGRDIARFNDADTTTQADVLALFDRAIAAAEAQS